MADNKNKKRQRAALMTVLNKLMDGDVSKIMALQNVDETSMNHLESVRDTVKEKFEIIKDLNGKIADEVEDDEDYAKIIDENMEFEVTFNSKLNLVKKFLEKKAAPPTVTQAAQPRASIDVKLPKLNIKKFSGNANDYQPFIESFTESVDKNKSIPNVQKLNYLMGFLTGEAENLLKGFRLTGDNYQKALTLLKERFGNPQILISQRL